MDGRNEGPPTTIDKPKMVIATNSENNAEFVSNPEFGKDANIKIVRIDLPKTLPYDTKETQWGANPNYIAEDFNPNYIVIAVDLNRNQDQDIWRNKSSFHKLIHKNRNKE